MELPVKNPPHVVPDYSLTGDVLSYSRCSRSYRYYNGSSLPPSRPVQLWYGEFIHGMMESCYRLWKERGDALPFPLPCAPLDRQSGIAPPDDLDPLDLRVIGWPIEQALAREGKLPRSFDARASAYRRADAAVNRIGPHLFPLVEAAERTVIGSRTHSADDDQIGRGARYILRGIVDVLGHVQLSRADEHNPIVSAIAQAFPDLPPEYEIIVDYKGSRRPPRSTDPRSDWLLGEWQVQTYAWLRSRQPDALPVVAGVLVYVSELAPGGKEMRSLRTEIANASTDVAPPPGSHDLRSIEAWAAGTEPNLTPEFMMRRALRVLPVTQASMQDATGQIDRVVASIEACVASEREVHAIKQVWDANSQSEDSCAACDFRAGCEGNLARGDDGEPEA
ncbi:MAG: PD-(D/E)XK nuclease family protein [Erythrobacter sp.]|jgi:hypothetical protein|nr:PD-(D/E)XK nuclease family protein [Erythrobacter sp.]